MKEVSSMYFILFLFCGDTMNYIHSKKLKLHSGKELAKWNKDFLRFKWRNYHCLKLVLLISEQGCCLVCKFLIYI